MKSKRSAEGYLMIDHRASPGLPPGFMRSLGLDGPDAPGGQLTESATNTCAHCGTIVVLNPDRTRARGYCQKCDAYICDNPACNAECKPLTQALDAMESNIYRQQQNHLVLSTPLIKDHNHG